MKNVYLLGDSIRMGYGPYVERLLEGCAKVYQPPENGRWAGFTLNNLVQHQWLQDTPDRFDVVHWNNGIWDMNARHEEDGPFSTIAYYTECLRKIIRVLRKMTPHIIFATSTPPQADHYVSPEYGRCLLPIETAVVYNKAAVEVMREEGIEVDDLYSLILASRDQPIWADNTHFNGKGYEICARQIADKIRGYL